MPIRPPTLREISQFASLTPAGLEQHQARARERALLTDTLAERLAARGDLAKFVPLFSKTQPYLMGWFHRDLCEVLNAFEEAVARRRSPRLMIFAPPRTGKSEPTSRCLPPWLLGRHPEWELIAATYNQDFANDWGRDVRTIIDDPIYRDLFQQLQIRRDSNAVDYFRTTAAGSYTTVGKGGSLTGRGCHVLIIDDPLKDRAEADSEVERSNLIKWYESTARTRLAPGGGIIIIQCMTGDTQVRLPDGSEKPLRDIRPGDMISTYDNGTLTSATVRNWRNCGPDSVLEIRMTSGTVVRANERHPFLVARPGGLEWVRVRNLKPGDRILRVIGGSGAARPAASLDAPSLFHARGAAPPTTTSTAGAPESAPRAATPSPGAPPISSTATASPCPKSRPCSLPRETAAPSASSPPPGPTSGDTGAASASITTTPQERSVGFCATTATSPSGTGKHQPSCSPPPSTFSTDTIESIIPAGVEDVFDIEVERTENFIANGLVSHNTRWHEVDLAGHLLEKAQQNPEADQWLVYSYEAIATKNEKHRRIGEALHPERYPLSELLKIKASIDPREWSALYQQSPVPPEGIAFKSEWFLWAKPPAPPTELNWYIGTDFAIGEKQTNDATCLWPFAVDARDDIWFDVPVHGRFTAMEIVEHLCDLMERYRPREVAIENVHISKTIGPYLRKRMQERRIYTTLREMTPTKDKLARTGTLRGRMQQRKVHFHPATKSDVLPEFLSFPAGRHDDRVDAASTGMMMLDTLIKARPDPEKPKDPAPEWSMAWMQERIRKSTAPAENPRHIPRHLNGKPRKTKAAPTWTG